MRSLLPVYIMMSLGFMLTLSQSANAHAHFGISIGGGPVYYNAVPYYGAIPYYTVPYYTGAPYYVAPGYVVPHYWVDYPRYHRFHQGYNTTYYYY